MRLPGFPVAMHKSPLYSGGSVREFHPVPYSPFAGHLNQGIFSYQYFNANSVGLQGYYLADAPLLVEFIDWVVWC